MQPQPRAPRPRHRPAGASAGDRGIALRAQPRGCVAGRCPAGTKTRGRGARGGAARSMASGYSVRPVAGSRLAADIAAAAPEFLVAAGREDRDARRRCDSGSRGTPPDRWSAAARGARARIAATASASRSRQRARRRRQRGSRAARPARGRPGRRPAAGRSASAASAPPCARDRGGVLAVERARQRGACRRRRCRPRPAASAPASAGSGRS